MQTTKNKRAEMTAQQGSGKSSMEEIKARAAARKAGGDGGSAAKVRPPAPHRPAFIHRGPSVHRDAAAADNASCRSRSRRPGLQIRRRMQRLPARRLPARRPRRRRMRLARLTSRVSSAR